MKNILFEVNASTFFDGNISLSDILEEYTYNNNFVYNQPENIFLIGIYVPVFLTALIANILVIAVFIKYHSFRTVTNLMLTSLSVADLLVTLICMPAAVGQAIHNAWLFGNFICKTTHYLQGVAVGSSVFTLTLMSLDRLLAIRHPLKRKNCVSKKRTIKVIFILWCCSLLIFAPILYVRKTDGFRIHTFEFVYCLEEWRNPSHQRIFGIGVFLFVYAIPGIIIVVAYALMGFRLRRTHLLPDVENESTTSRHQICTVTTVNLMKERRKVARTLMILAMAFAICWLPSSILGLILELYVPNTKASTSEYEFYVKLHQYFILLGHLNSLLNPLLYSLLTKNFRNNVKDWLKSMCNQ